MRATTDRIAKYGGAAEHGRKDRPQYGGVHSFFIVIRSWKQTMNISTAVQAPSYQTMMITQSFEAALRQCNIRLG